MKKSHEFYQKVHLFFLVHTVWIVERHVLVKHASVRPLVQFPIGWENAKETVFLPMRKTCWLPLPCAQNTPSGINPCDIHLGEPSSLRNETKTHSCPLRPLHSPKLTWPLKNDALKITLLLGLHHFQGRPVKLLPSRELTYPTWGKENHLQKCLFGGIC